MQTQNLVLRTLLDLHPALGQELARTAYRKGQILMETGQRIDRVYFPDGGLVSSRLPFESGEEVECILSGRDGAVGLLGVAGLGVSATRSVCITELHAWSVPVARLRGAMDASPPAAELVARLCRAQIFIGLRVGACNAVHGAASRLARWLLTASELLDAAPVEIRQEELATLLGVQRSAVNPVLRRLQSAQLIRMGRGQIVVLDPGRLAGQACSCHPVLSRATRDVALPDDDGAGC